MNNAANYQKVMDSWIDNQHTLLTLSVSTFSNTPNGTATDVGRRIHEGSLPIRLAMLRDLAPTSTMRPQQFPGHPQVHNKIVIDKIMLCAYSGDSLNSEFMYISCCEHPHIVFKMKLSA